MRVVVVGSTGVLGRRVVPALLARGHDVTALARSLEAAGRLPTDARVRIGDVWDPHFLRASFNGADAVTMLATAIPPLSRMMRRAAWRTNDRVRSGLAPLVAQAAADSGVAVLVQESMMYAYADGGTGRVTEDSPLRPAPQATACLVAERAARRFLTTGAGASRAVALRFALFAAPEADSTQATLAMARKGRMLRLGDDRGWTTWVHSHDAAAAVGHALAVPSGIYNVGAEPVTRAQQADDLAAAVGRAQVRPVPRWGGRLLPRLLPMADSLGRSIALDSGKLRATGWQPQLPDDAAIWRRIAAEVDA